MDEQLVTGAPVEVEQDAPAGDKESLATIKRLYKVIKPGRVADKRWRGRAKKGVEFYFGRQWDAADKRKLEERGQPVITINRIKPTIRLIHGLVVSQPIDILAKPVGKNDDDVADVATAALKYVNNVNDYKTLRETVYFDGLTYGRGWALAGFYVSNRDRRSEAVQNRRIDPREITADPQGQALDGSDLRWVDWKRRVDIEDLQAEYPKHAAALAKLAGCEGKYEQAIDTWDGVPNYTPPVDLWQSINEDFDNWNQADKGEDGEGVKKLAVHELWERYPVKAWLVERADGTVEEFEGDPESPEGMQAILSDPTITSYYEDTIYKVRFFVFCGPLLLHEADSPYDHDRLPFVPCYCEMDEYGDPVSMVDSLIDVQREVNHRRSKALHEMTKLNIRVTPEALGSMGLTIEELQAKAKETISVFVARSGEVEFMPSGMNIGEHFNLMQDAKQEIQSVSGANDDLMGYDSQSKSGKSKEVSMSQGQMLMRPTESNLRLFDKAMATLNLMLIQQAHTEEWTFRIRDEVGRDKFFTLNQREDDPTTGERRVLNTIEGMRFDLELDAMPWTPTLRERAAEMINGMANNEPDPMIRNALRLAAINASDIPDKAKVLDIFQGVMNAMQAPPPMPGAPPGMPAAGPPPGMVPGAPPPPEAMPPEILPPAV